MPSYKVGEILWWVEPGYVGLGINYFKPGPMEVHSGRVISFDDVLVCLSSQGQIVFRQPTELTRDFAQANEWLKADSPKP